MMKKIAIAAVCLFTSLSATSFAGTVDLGRINFKRTFCNNQDFLGNAASKRPHLHCGANFISYKKANGDHSNITDMGDCNRTNSVFDDIKANKTAFTDYPGIYDALVLYHQAGCPNQ